MSTRCPVPTVNEDLCTLCGLCVEACPCGAVTLGERGPVFKDHIDADLDCDCAGEVGAGCIHLCEEVCPTGAITCEFSIVSADQSVDAHGGCQSCGCSGGSDCSAS